VRFVEHDLRSVELLAPAYKPRYRRRVRITVLGSGSGGNVTLIETATTRVLVDAGLTQRALLSRLASLEPSADSPQRFDAIVLTHAHGDHIGHAGAYALRFDAPVFLTEATARSLRMPSGVRTRVFGSKTAFDVGDLELRPLPVPHDAPQIALVLAHDGQSAGLVTDLGAVPDALPDHLRECTTVLVESNHDRELLSAGPYPDFLKRRIASGVGHLENRQCAELLRALSPATRHVVLMHLSQTNNAPSLARSVAEDALGGRGVRLHVATQDAPLGVPLERAPVAPAPAQLRLF
jgi:phosphoribosyl 1,2-cyclic phosphodiesterase